MDKANQGVETFFKMLNDELVAMGRWIYLPEDKALKEEILREAYESRFTVHPRSTKIFQDLKEFYCWPNMKREIIEYLARYGFFQQIKVEHQKIVAKL